MTNRARTGLAARACLAVGLAWGCGGARVAEPGPRGTVRFACEPADAVLEVDETRLGPADMFAERGLLLQPGTHRVVLRSAGRFPEFRLIEVADGELLVVEISLRP
ncbi:MAG TPA: hypothetical protein VM285_02330, partial [Polyangia bacterium]|nr:hypothetical protein [Polyangia bacterium]